MAKKLSDDSLETNGNGLARATSDEVKRAASLLDATRVEVGRVFIGQQKVVESLLRALLCDGHVLLEGVPGIAKTLVIKALAQASGCTSNRVQFTVDLLPTDILGLTTYDPNKGFEVVKGPIFANFIIADEINRSPPKTQSALIEAMQEKQVTIGKETYKLPSPFFLMANQNPLESEGVYNLPEAQVDRFIFKINFGYPEPGEEMKIMEQNVTFKKFEDFNLKAVLSPQKISMLQKLTHRVYIDDKIKKYILSIVNKTRTKDFPHGKYVELGGSPRANIALFIASKAQALLKGRNYVIPEDVKDVAKEVLRHRLIISYRAKAEGVSTDTIVEDILKAIKIV